MVDNFLGIASEELAIVVQGPVFESDGVPHTLNLLAQLVSDFPAAQIIFSTWRGAEVTEKGFEVIESEDPGEIEGADQFLRNALRLQTSTLAGLRVASRKFCLKLRSDHALGYIGRSDIDASVLSDKIMLFMHSMPFHPFLIDDKAQLSMTEQLLDFWGLNFERLYSDFQEVGNTNPVVRKHVLNHGSGPYFDQLLALQFIASEDLEDADLKSCLGMFFDLQKNRFIYLNGPELGLRSAKHHYERSVSLSAYVLFINRAPRWLKHLVFKSLAWFREFRRLK